MTNNKFIFAILLGVMMISFSCSEKYEYPLSEEGFNNYTINFEKKLAPLENKNNLAEWNAYITGQDQYFKEADEASLQIDSLYQNQKHFAYIKELKEKNLVKNELLKRQLDVLYYSFLKKQGNPELNKEITELTSEISQKFINFRAEYDGKTVTDNQITELLKSEKNLQKREGAWRAQKEAGKLIAADLQKLVKLRNKMAAELGFSNYYELAMMSKEQDPADVKHTFEELAALTDEPFRAVHDEVETVLSKRFGIAKDELRPWHYEDLFSQEAPAIYQVNLDTYFKNVDIPSLAENYYRSFDMDIESILAASDLYEKEGKNQHAFSFCMDRGQDIRVLLNIVPNQRWMDTMMHESGHAVYDKYINTELPYLLRTPAHSFTTEGIAMFFGGMASNPLWMKKALNMNEEEIGKIRETIKQSDRLAKMMFARWSLVMKFFEEKMYADPDQDLNKLWWDLVERYQYITRPENLNGGEWASKVHLIGYPAYYHNYLLGELFAAQIRHTVAEEAYDHVDPSEVTFWDNPKAGQLLKDKVFMPGNRWYWNEMIQNATGEKLTAKYFVATYIE